MNGHKGYRKLIAASVLALFFMGLGAAAAGLFRAEEGAGGGPLQKPAETQEPFADNIEPQDTAARREKSLLAMKDGDIEGLAGFPFGAPYDYDLFEITGSGGGSNLYRLKDSENRDLLYLFDGTGGSFSGLSCNGSWYREEDFFGIRMCEDTLETVTDILGEPQDTWEEENNSREKITCCVWNFEKAALTVKIQKGRIWYVIYEALPATIDAAVQKDVETDFERDMRESGDTAEAIYRWSSIYGSSYSRPEDAVWIPGEEGYDEAQLDALVENYLRERGITADDVASGAVDTAVYSVLGNASAEAYVGGDDSQYTFVFRRGSEEDGDTVWCTTYYLDEEDRVGSLLRHWDEERGVTRERLYDVYGRRMADITYEYIPSFPFPLIVDYWNIDTRYDPAYEALCRNQMTWFYKEKAQFDENGRITAYEGGSNPEDGKEYFGHSLSFHYDENGVLAEIREELQEQDLEENTPWKERGYSGYMTLEYGTDDIVQGLDYSRSIWVYGSWDSTGEVLYDGQGRMLYRSYYVTHGGHEDILLYEKGDEVPWCSFHSCSYAPGFESIYLFRTIE